MQASNKIILGTVQFGLEYGINNTSGKPAEGEVKSILETAWMNGIHLLDTAEAYGNSQEIIGNYHRKANHTFDVITKFSSGRNDLSQDITERIMQDIKTMNLSSIYGYMFHSFNDYKSYYSTFKSSLAELKMRGLVKRWGVSIYTNNEFEQLLNKDKPDIIQLPFNLLDNNMQRADLIRKAKDKGVEVHTRSVFLQGLFFKKDLPGKLALLEPYLEKIKDISNKRNFDLTDLALNYAVQQKNIDYVLVGVDSLGHLRDNLDSLKKEIPQSVLAEIDSLLVKETELLNPSNWKA